MSDEIRGRQGDTRHGQRAGAGLRWRRAGGARAGGDAGSGALGLRDQPARRAGQRDHDDGQEPVADARHRAAGHYPAARDGPAIQRRAAHRRQPVDMGDDTYGQLGYGGNGGLVTTPTRVPGLSGVIEVALGDEGSGDAVEGDGSVWAWGDNSHAQLGNGSTNSTSSPIRVPLLTGVRHVAA